MTMWATSLEPLSLLEDCEEEAYIDVESDLSMSEPEEPSMKCI